ncbi:hypothetical protein BDN67DRAFT_969872 [Paxillus ammoniavirescens]|nr:hypothetical protein BDN67DRAFT_969872 [Paxillus ammoniavirescens]
MHTSHTLSSISKQTTLQSRRNSLFAFRTSNRTHCTTSTSLRRRPLVSTQNHDQLPTIHIPPFPIAFGFDLWLWFSLPPSLQPFISSSRVTPVSSFDGMESYTSKSDNFVWDLRVEADEPRLARSSRSPSDSNFHYYYVIPQAACYGRCGVHQL